MNPATITRSCVWLHTRRAFLDLTQRLDRELAPHGLNASQFMILASLGAGGLTPLPRLATALGLERTTLYRTLRPLAEAGLVEIIPSPRGRTRTAGLTPAGGDRLARSARAWERFDQDCRRTMGSERWPALISTLAWMVEARGGSAR